MCHGYIISLLIHSLQMFKKYDKVYTCNIKKRMINNEKSNNKNDYQKYKIIHVMRKTCKMSDKVPKLCSLFPIQQLRLIFKVHSRV